MTCCVYCWVRSQRLEPASFVLDGMSCCEPCGRPMLEIIGRNIRDYEAKGRRDERGQMVRRDSEPDLAKDQGTGN